MTRLRKAVYKKLDPDERNDRISRSIDLFLIVLIAVNVLAVILETVESIETRYHEQLWLIEVISVAVFSVEYLARVWVSVEDPRFRDRSNPRLSYMLSPMALIDLLAILPFYLGFFLQMDLRFLRVLRLLRILKLTRYSAAMSMLLDVFREESNAFFAGFFILIVMLVLAASGAYLAEHQVQPDKFGSIPAAMWWAGRDPDHRGLWRRHTGYPRRRSCSDRSWPSWVSGWPPYRPVFWPAAWPTACAAPAKKCLPSSAPPWKTA